MSQLDMLPTLARTQSAGEEFADDKNDSQEVPVVVVVARPPVIWDKGWDVFVASFGARLRAVFSRRLVLSLLVRFTEQSPTPLLMMCGVGGTARFGVYHLHVRRFYRLGYQGVQCAHDADLVLVSFF